VITGGFILGGKTARELGITMLRTSRRAALSQTRDKTLVIPGRHGEYDFGSDMGPKVFELDCSINTRNSYMLQQAVRNLARHLMEGTGRSRVMDLILDLEPDLVYKVRLTGDLPIDRASGLGKFTLKLTAFDPLASFRYAAGEIDVDSDISVDSYINVDQSPYVFNVTSAKSVIIENIGDVEARPLITVTGSFSTLTLTVDGLTFAYNAAFSGVTPLRVDSNEYTAKIGAVNVLGNTLGSFVALRPGISTLQIGGTGLNCIVTMKFMPKFI
jgi:phage-related protein